MKKLLTFIPLGVGISSLIIYIFNIVSFRVINNTVAMSQILYNLKMYLYVSIISFVLFAVIKVFIYMNEKHQYVTVVDDDKEKDSNDEYVTPIVSTISEDIAEPVFVKEIEEPVINEKEEIKIDNPVLVKQEEIKSNKTTNEKEQKDIYAYEPFESEEAYENYVNQNNTITELNVSNCYCPKCGSDVFESDVYCKKCGTPLVKSTKKSSSLFKDFINVLEIVILILIIYFALNMLFDYKASKDPNFKSPFKVSMTK